MSMRVHPEPDRCDCYECAGPEYMWSIAHGRQLANDMLYHTFLTPCPDCGQPQTEYQDLGTKGRYVCWWCRDRAAGDYEVAYP